MANYVTYYLTQAHVIAIIMQKGPNLLAFRSTSEAFPVLITCDSRCQIANK